MAASGSAQLVNVPEQADSLQTHVANLTYEVDVSKDLLPAHMGSMC